MNVFLIERFSFFLLRPSGVEIAILSDIKSFLFSSPSSTILGVALADTSILFSFQIRFIQTVVDLAFIFILLFFFSHFRFSFLYSSKRRFCIFPTRPPFLGDSLFCFVFVSCMAVEDSLQ